MKNIPQTFACAALLVLLVPVSSGAYYSPEQGTWISRDPIEERGGNNGSCFVGNTPVRSFDVRGLYGSGEHHQITQQALHNAAPDITSNCRTRIYTILMRGNMAQDLPVVGHAGDLERHFNRKPGSEAQSANADYESYINGELRNFSAPQNRSSKHKCYESLLALGRLLHSWQDFYSHAVLEHENETFTFKVWSRSQGRTPDNPWPLVPSTYPGEHPALGEPVSAQGDQNEWDSRLTGATDYSSGRLAELLPRWLEACRCSCENANWFYIGSGRGR